MGTPISLEDTADQNVDPGLVSRLNAVSTSEQVNNILHAKREYDFGILWIHDEMKRSLMNPVVVERLGELYEGYLDLTNALQAYAILVLEETYGPNRPKKSQLELI